MMVPIIRALNEDCVAVILSFVDAPTLVNVARTSRSAKVVALPFLVRTVRLRTYRPEDIVLFCRSVLHNRLARYIRHLNIYNHQAVMFDSVLLGAMPGLVEVITSAENLACLRISACVGRLFHHAPTLRDSILIRPPSRSLELIDLTEWQWLVIRPFVGLRNLSLGLVHPTTDPVSLYAFTATAASTLETMHLEGSGWLDFLSIRFTSGCAPCPKMRMLSLARARILLTDLTDLGQAFPDLRFIRCGDLDLSRDSSRETLPAFVTDGSQAFSKLVGLSYAPLDIVELLGARRTKFRALSINDHIDTMPQLTRLITALAWSSICSLELEVQLRVEEGLALNDRIPADHFFAEICRVAPRLQFLSLSMDIVPVVPILDTDPTAERQREAHTTYVRAAALRHLVGLDNLRCLDLTFEVNGHEAYAYGKAEFAAFILANLPCVEFFLLGNLVNADYICLERPEAARMGTAGVADAVRLELYAEEMVTRLQRYQFDGSDPRLDGVADWLASIRDLGRV